jgi:HK97 gp10 family phage protein
MARASFGIKAEGIKEFEAALADLGRSLGRNVLERSLRKAAKPMLDLAKEMAPHDQGDLEHSLKIARDTVSDPGKAAFAEVMQATGNRDAARAALRDAYRTQGGAVVDLVLGPDLNDGGHTAHIVEFGTGPRYLKSGKSVGEMPPDPFLRPAFDAEARLTVERLKPILRSEIDKAVTRRAARQARS